MTIFQELLVLVDQKEVWTKHDLKVAIGLIAGRSDSFFQYEGGIDEIS